MVSLAERISLILSLSRPRRLPGYVKDVVMNVDGHVLLLDARELECCGYGVRLFVVMDIHPTCM
jgi:hypothetical protein